MTNYKLRSKKIKIILIALALFFISKVYAEPVYYSFGVNKVQGEAWEKGIIDTRQVIKSDQIGEAGEVELLVPEDGYYQLYIHLYHEWEKYCPYLFFNAIDSKSHREQGYIYSEYRWYLSPGQGRWEFRAPSAAPLWYFHKGLIQLKFWLESKDTCWNQVDVPAEAFVAIDQFILIPVVGKDKKSSYHPKNVE